MMTMFYSPSKNAFYPKGMRRSYEAAGNWPEDAVEITSDEWSTYGQGEVPAGYQRGADENGRPTWVPIPPPDLTTLAARKRDEIFTSRDAAFAAGMDYTLPDGKVDVVQTRPQDQINLLGLGIKAERLVNQGVTDAVMEFRGESNVTHMITPADMVALTDAALTHIEGVYQHSWSRKDEIDAALTAGDREGIEAVVW